MDRPSLETLSRDELIVRARAAGIARPEVLTRAELVDELLRRSSADPPTRARARGFFGRARDLIATVIERGLHLPEAAQRVRNPVPVDEDPAPPAPVATVTLAEIYAAQGHLERALSVLDDLLQGEPDHAQARALSSRLRSGPPPAPAEVDPRIDDGLADDLGSSLSAATPPKADAEVDAEVDAEAKADAAPPASTLELEVEPPGPGKRPMLDDAPLPQRYDVDEAVVMPVDPTTAFVYWELREGTLARVRQLQPRGRLAVRLFIESANWQGVAATTRDIITDATVGDYFVFGLPEGATLRASIGWLVGEAFDAIADGPAYHAPPGAPSRLVATTLVRWTPDVVPPTPIEPPPFLADALAAVQNVVATPGARQRPAHLPLPLPLPGLAPPPGRSKIRGQGKAGALPEEEAFDEAEWSDELEAFLPLGASETLRRRGEWPDDEAPGGASESWGVSFLKRSATGPQGVRGGRYVPTSRLRLRSRHLFRLPCGLRPDQGSPHRRTLAR